MAEGLERWTRRIARDFRRIHSTIDRTVRDEAEHLRSLVSRFAPRRTGALRASFVVVGKEVLSRLPYALQVDRGGRIYARRRDMLTIPIRSGYAHNSPGLVTVTSRGGVRYVTRSGRTELWAVRRRSVLTSGRRYLDRALQAHLLDADDRVIDQVNEVIRG